jgi:hypothetical protein
MIRVRTRSPRFILAIAAVLSTGLAHATTDTASAVQEQLITPARSASLEVVWEELKVGGDKSFNTFILRNPVLEANTADSLSRPPRPVPDLLWVLGAGIIGLATVARRRSH